MPLSLPVLFQGVSHRTRGAMRQYLRRLPLSLLCWTGVVILESSEVFVGDASRGYVLPTAHYLVWAILNWYIFALISPLVYQLGLRYPITGPNWAMRLISPHAIGCICWMISQAVLRGLAGFIYTENHEIPTSATLLVYGWFEQRGMLALLAYWIIVIIAGFAHMREQVRQRELREAQLESRLASAELEKLRMQIHPHFLFNTLQAAITLVQEDPRAAEDVLLRLSELLRISLDQIDSNEIPLARELEFLDLYTGIQRRRFGDRLAVEIHAGPETLHLLVPPLILQPLVENAIRHGIGKHKGADTVEVFAHSQSGELQIEVWNSNSTVEGSAEQLFHRGVGLRNTRARLENLYGAAGTLVFRALARGGAGVLIALPAHKAEQSERQPVAQVAQ